MVAAQALPNLPELTAERAGHWVAAALAEAHALRQYDADLHPAGSEPAAVEAAEQLHEVWRRWADEASNLYRRIQPLLAAGSHVAGADDLDYALARAYAMLKLPPRVMLERAAQVRAGNVLTSEEVRRALRVADRG